MSYLRAASEGPGEPVLPLTHKRDTPRAIGATRDIARLELAGQAALVALVVAATTPFMGTSRSLWIPLLSALWLVAMQVSFSAHRNELLPLGSAAAVVRGACIGAIGVTAATAELHGPHLGIGRLAFAGLAVSLLVGAWHRVYLRYLEPQRRVLIVGTGNGASELIQELDDTRGPRFEVIGVVADEGEPTDECEALLVGSINEIPAVIERLQPDLVVLALTHNRPAVFGLLLDSADSQFRVVEAAQLFEHALGRVPVRDVSGAWFMSVLHLYQRPYSQLTQRIFDIVCAVVGLVATAPLVPLIVLGVRSSRGPLLLRQIRVGEHGQLFTIFKFRTMRADAEVKGHAVWATEGDSRVTPAGRVLRRLRLDEIPQLWNVLKGEMSIVGPRPERPEFMELLEAHVPFWSRRQLVKPGITGWAQIRRGYTSDAEGSIDKLSYDLWYIRHRSITVDIAICLQTLGALLGVGSGETVVAPEEMDRELASSGTAGRHNGSGELPLGGLGGGVQSEPIAASTGSRFPTSHA